MPIGSVSRRAALLALAALPAACSSPNPTLYVLAPIPGTTHAGAPKVIALRAISIAHYLERSQIVRSSESYRIDVLSNEWWGEPLDTMMGRILVQELNQRLPGSTVYADSGAISTPPDATVEINLQRLDLDRQGALLLVAQVAVDGRELASRGVSLTVQPADPTTRALVAAMSEALARLADTIASMVVPKAQAAGRGDGMSGHTAGVRPAPAHPKRRGTATK